MGLSRTKIRRKFGRLNQAGQAVVEYILMLALVISLFGALSIAFNKWISYLWQVMTCEVSAACPGCQPDPNIKNKIAKGCK